MYKTSKYNYFIENGGSVIYSNGLSNQCFSVKKIEHERLQLLLNDLISFEINYNSVFLKFLDWGFIINDDIDEIDIIRYRNRKATIESRDYNLVINPTLECNFNCWYCYENHPKGYMNKNTVELIKKHVDYMVEKRRIDSLHLSWFGGEPLLYFDEIVFPISSYAKEVCTSSNIPYSSSITTNASKINMDMIYKMISINMNDFQITIDGSPARHNKIRNEKGVPSFDLIMNNINRICELNEHSHITLRINYDDKTLKDNLLKEVFENIPTQYRKRILPNFQRVWQTFEKRGKDNLENVERTKIIQICNDLGFKFDSPSNAFQPGKYYKCYVDRFYHAEINYDGKVYSCTARDYSDDYVTGVLKETGELVWNETERVKRYSKATFENAMCLKCKYLPLGLGPCSQKIKETSKEHLKDLCYLSYTEVSPETVIIEYFNRKMRLLREHDAGY